MINYNPRDDRLSSPTMIRKRRKLLILRRFLRISLLLYFKGYFVCFLYHRSLSCGGRPPTPPRGCCAEQTATQSVATFALARTSAISSNFYYRKLPMVSSALTYAKRLANFSVVVTEMCPHALNYLFQRLHRAD